MGKKEKLTKRLKQIPKDFTFEEMQTLLLMLGFCLSNKGKTSGSRVKFIKDEIIIILHKPHPRKELLEYQIKQVLEVLSEEELI
ncbi:MAG: type II toxin-antitoxin system HicA family toxin [Clostridiaceae bacterium]|nr:type II toxin-antitoxin system HicA family toxin [Clostridiaceae bacterium]